MSEVKVCPECGARSDEIIDSLFSGRESIIRDHGDWIECKKCGYQGEPRWDTEEEP